MFCVRAHVIIFDFHVLFGRDEPEVCIVCVWVCLFVCCVRVRAREIRDTRRCAKCVVGGGSHVMETTM